MSSKADGKLFKRDPYIKGDHIQLYIIQNKELSKLLGHPTYFNYNDFCWNSNIDHATRFEGKDDPRIPTDYKKDENVEETFLFIEVER